MKYSKIYLLGVALFPTFGLISPTQAAPLVSIGDFATVHFIGNASTYYTTNLFNNDTNEVEDVVLTIVPGLEFVSARGAANITYGGSVRYEIRRFDDRDDQNTELLQLNAYGKYENARMVVDASASFAENQKNSGTANVVGSLLEYETTSLSLNGEYRLSPKFSFGAGVTYSETNYTSFETVVADTDYVQLPFDLFYELTPKLDLSAGYTYTDRTVEDRVGLNDGYDSESHFFNVGLRGELLPKLTGSAKAGYTMREQSGVSDESTLGVDASLIWATTPKLVNTFTFGRDFGVAGQGTGTESTNFVLNSRYSISSQYYANANVGYTMTDYLYNVREDTLFDLGISLSYVPNQYWTLSTGYTYMENDSNTPTNSFTSHKINLSATLRY